MTTTSSPERQAVTLVEYGEAELRLAPQQALTFRRLAGNRVALLPGDAPNIWRVKASSYVGTLATPYVKVLIRPKVPTANLFHLLESSGRALSLGAEVFDYDTTGDLIPSFATFYARHLEAALASGIPREYQEHPRPDAQSMPWSLTDVGLARRRRPTPLPPPDQASRARPTLIYEEPVMPSGAGSRNAASALSSESGRVCR